MSDEIDKSETPTGEWSRRRVFFIAMSVLAVFIAITRLYNLGLKPVQHDESMFAYYAYGIFTRADPDPSVDVETDYKLVDFLNPKKIAHLFQGYDYMPILHGPVLEWGAAIVFFIFGHSTATMRLFPALCALMIFWLMWKRRIELGLLPASIAMLLLAISPIYTYYSRFCRTDLTVHLAYVLIIFFAWSYAKYHRWWQILLTVVSVWYATACKETYVIFFFLIATFAYGCWLWGMIKHKDWKEMVSGHAILILAAASAYYGIIRHVSWKVNESLAGTVSEQYAMEHDTTPPGFFIFVITILLIFIGLGLHGRFTKKDYSDIPVYRDLRRAMTSHWYAVIAGMGLGFLLTEFMFSSMFTYEKHTVLFGDHGIMGQVSAFQYWQSEHHKHRIYGPFHYYWIFLLSYELPMTLIYLIGVISQTWARRGNYVPQRRLFMLLYFALSMAVLFIPASVPSKMLHTVQEIRHSISGDEEAVPDVEESSYKDRAFWNWKLPREVASPHPPKFELGLHLWLFWQTLFFIMVAGWKHLSEGRTFLAFCVYWTGGSLLAYGYSGEKVPWVTTHIILPMTFVCGYYIYDLWQKFTASARDEAKALNESVSIPDPEESKPSNKTKKSNGKKGASAKSSAATDKRSSGRKSESSLPSRNWKKTVALGALGVYLAIGFGWTLYIQMIANFRQPGSPVERLSYASSHTEYHAAITYLLDEIENDWEGEKRPTIAMEGTHEWPTHWYLRDYHEKVWPSVPANTTAEYILLDNEVWNRGKPFWDKYEWGRIKFRHYWQPAYPNYEVMLNFPLVLGSAEGLSATDAQKREAGRGEWNRFFTFYFLRSEELTGSPTIDGADNPGYWPHMGGYDVYFGKRKDLR